MGMCLCEKHGRQHMKTVCPHLRPGDQGTEISMLGGFVPVLACADCVAKYAVEGDVPEELDGAFSDIVHSWCLRCWDEGDGAPMAT